MTVDGDGLVNQLMDAEGFLKNQLPNWGIVTVPVDPQNPDQGNAISAPQIFAINAKSSNIQAAWEFVKYINGDEFARVTSKGTASGGIPSRLKYLSDNFGRNMEAFYKLKPNDYTQNSGARIPPTFNLSFSSIAEQETRDAFEGRKTIKEALDTMQSQGQMILQTTFQENN